MLSLARREGTALIHAKRFSTSAVLLSLVSSTITLLPTPTLAAAQSGPHAEFPPAMQAGASPSVHLDPPSRAAHATPRPFVSTHQAQASSPHDQYTAYSHTWRDTGQPVTTNVYLAPHFHEKGGAWSEVDTTVRSRDHE